MKLLFLSPLIISAVLIFGGTNAESTSPASTTKNPPAVADPTTTPQTKYLTVEKPTTGNPRSLQSSTTTSPPPVATETPLTHPPQDTVEAQKGEVAKSGPVAETQETNSDTITNHHSKTQTPDGPEGAAKETIVIYNKIPSSEKPTMLLVNEDQPDLSENESPEIPWIAAAHDLEQIGGYESYFHDTQPNSPTADELGSDMTSLPYWTHDQLDMSSLYGYTNIDKPTDNDHSGSDESAHPYWSHDSVGDSNLEQDGHSGKPTGDSSSDQDDSPHPHFPDDPDVSNLEHHAHSGKPTDPSEPHEASYPHWSHGSLGYNTSLEDLVLESAMEDWIEEALSSENPDWANLLAHVVEKERAALEEAKEGGDKELDDETMEVEKSQETDSQGSESHPQDESAEELTVEDEAWEKSAAPAPRPHPHTRPRSPSRRHRKCEKEYDWVIVGGGPAGCVLANRLSEVPHWSVLLLEAGREEVPIMDIPFLIGQFQTTDANWHYATVPQEQSCKGLVGHRCDYAQGRVLGGSTAINYMFNIRGNRLDFDTWATLGNTGWDYERVLPYFKKVENMQIPELRNSSYHGTEGNVYVNYSPYQSELSKRLVSAHEELGAEYVDYNGASQVGVSRMQTTTRDGTRWSAARAYIKPAADRPNLTVRTSSFVTKILFDEGTLTSEGAWQEPRALGVRYVRTRGHKKRWCQAIARKEVLVAGGAVNSPKLLMLSGVGPRGHLEELDIKVVKDLLVGYNLQDHVGFPMLHFVFKKHVAPTAVEIMTDPRTYAEFMITHDGPLTTPGAFETVAWSDLRDTPLFQPGWPPVELLHQSLSSLAVPTNAALFRIPLRTYKASLAPLIKRSAWMAMPIVMRPRSRGRVRLHSADAFDAPLIDPRALTHPYDRDVLHAGIKEVLKLLDAPSLYEVGARLHAKPVPPCRHFPFASDAYWRCAVRHFALTVFHPVGTCKMGAPDDPTAVVTPDLRVRGVHALRVVDSSVIPRLVSGHTQMATFMLAERAADIIKAAYGERVTTRGVHLSDLFYHYDQQHHDQQHYNDTQDQEEEEELEEEIDILDNFENDSDSWSDSPKPQCVEHVEDPHKDEDYTHETSDVEDYHYNPPIQIPTNSMPQDDHEVLEQENETESVLLDTDTYNSESFVNKPAHIEPYHYGSYVPYRPLNNAQRYYKKPPSYLNSHYEPENN